ncbi:sterol regulatory element binding protein cleavage-activating protein [Crucibulum laeve]|uniref:Sterol regulatory element-binding protein cleavage-activating protein n=1 Tax=Crucibulum laeve TaxID=68775 RepID=A0A5C3LNU4_9AGAR|nr:sterol regulatory element binding protein cleavage-activating protein [Crucibulum laeve]
MFLSSISLLQWVRKMGQRFFLQFGLHCATHQVRVILISCVVITSLFYPALSSYVSSQPTSLSIFDALFRPKASSAFDAQKDLLNVWSDYSALRVYDDAMTRAQCSGLALRVERILIQSPSSNNENNHIFLNTLELERKLQHIISKSHIPCLQKQDGNCLVLSPLAFWNYDEARLRVDTNTLDTLGYTKSVSIAGIPVKPHMVLASRGSYGHHISDAKFDFAKFLALTYFFPDSDCLSIEEHTQWLDTVRAAMPENTQLEETQPQGPVVMAVEYEPNLSKGKGWTALSVFLCFAYAAFVGYIVWSMRRMDAVHSRLGVTFTALVEIAVSTITSLSVCELVGFKVTMVPWPLLIIVIVFVGAENMFNLVDAVGRTRVTLSVKQRIAEGLSHAGTSNTLKVVSYNAILGILAVFSVGAVRQFCVFATVVLVAHWFLAHTFFIAVLSIDIARLELDELLRRDTSIAPAIPRASSDSLGSKQHQSGWRKLVTTTQNLLKGRAATNVSLLMLLTIAGALYYTTSTSSSRPDPASIAFGAVSRAKSHFHFTDSSIEQSPPSIIWKTFNPSQTPILRIRIEPPTIVTFNLDGRTSPEGDTKSHRTRFSMRTFHWIVWLIKIMVLPIAVTTSALWGLLLYLLKDTELLEAQRNRVDATTIKQGEDGTSLEGEVEFSTLPRAFASDVELIAASKDGQVVVSIGLRNEITVWRVDSQAHVLIDATDVLLKSASTSFAASTLTSVTVDEKGEYFAVGTGCGAIAVWALLRNGKVRPLPLLSLENSSAAVTELHFVPLRRSEQLTPPLSQPNSPASGPSSSVTLLATYESGLAVRWVVGRSPTVSFFTPSCRGTVVRSTLLHVIPEDRVLIAFSLDDGSLELVETGDYDITVLSDCYLPAGGPFDTVWKAHACRVQMGGSTRFVVAVATENGTVSLWDGATGECISVLEETPGKVSQLRVSPLQCETCHFCGQLPLESLSIAFSVDHVIRFYKLFLNDQTHTRRCSCSHSQLRHIPSREVLGRRSRSNSIASQSNSPLIPRARLATNFEASAFPVSAHGVHSRRASEKDAGRRSSEMLTVPFTGDEYELTRVHDGATTPTTLSFWRNAVVMSVTDLTCERGGWDVSSQKFVGIRRKPRSQGKTKGGTTRMMDITVSDGLTRSTLERWELWTFDPAAAILHNSLLTSLLSKTWASPRSSNAGDNQITRLPFTRVSPLLISPTHAFAGFGNTVGVFNFST